MSVNKNAAAYGCGNTRKPAQVHNHLHNGHKVTEIILQMIPATAAPHGIVYDKTALLTRVVFAAFSYAWCREYWERFAFNAV